MMLENIQQKLADLSKQFGDKRIHLCQLDAGKAAGGSYELSGMVLDTSTLAAVDSGLSAAFPDLQVNTGQVAILRQAEPQMLTVATNLTGLHARPTWASEMASQLFNGWQLELLKEEGSWAFIRQTDGYLGWAYRPYLSQIASPPPTHIVCRPEAPLLHDPANAGSIVCRIVAGTSVHVSAVDNGWATLQLAGGHSGHVPISSLRSLDALTQNGSSVRQQMISDGYGLIGVPYLWGGCSFMGIDCSGFAQLLHRLAGIGLPRDADMQFEAGRPVEPPLQPGDLLFYGSEGDHRAISHVAVSLGGWDIIHSSRSRNGVYVEDMKANESLWNRFLGARSFVSD